MHEELLVNLYDRLQEASSVDLVVDMWENRDIEGSWFIGILANTVNESTLMRESFLLSFESLITRSHASDALALAIKRTLDRFNLTFKLNKLICDGSNNNITTSCSKLLSLIEYDAMFMMDEPRLCQILRFKGEQSIIHCNSHMVHDCVKSFLSKLNFTEASTTKPRGDGKKQQNLEEILDMNEMYNRWFSGLVSDTDIEATLHRMANTADDDGDDDTTFEKPIAQSNIDKFLSLDGILEDITSSEDKDQAINLSINPSITLDKVRSFIKTVSLNETFKESWKDLIILLNSNIEAENRLIEAENQRSNNSDDDGLASNPVENSKLKAKLPLKMIALDVRTDWGSHEEVVHEITWYMKLLKFSQNKLSEDQLDASHFLILNMIEKLGDEEVSCLGFWKAVYEEADKEHIKVPWKHIKRLLCRYESAVLGSVQIEGLFGVSRNLYKLQRQSLEPRVAEQLMLIKCNTITKTERMQNIYNTNDMEQVGSISSYLKFKIPIMGDPYCCFRFLKRNGSKHPLISTATKKKYEAFVDEETKKAKTQNS